MKKIKKDSLPSRHVSLGPKSSPHRSYYYAMGMTEDDINNLFVVEAIMLSGSGAIMGLILGHSITQILKVAFPDFNFVPPMWASYLSLFVALISGIIFGLLPARRAAKLDPVEALSGNK